ncbi:MAG TPA: 50S ribosomal protein L29 [Desulfomicrobiaceae bacterium]|jgi:large subunit ribosomal protein L29|nr:50S ribosomal protein L29 [Desulfomicrobiaceae bacterium]
MNAQQLREMDRDKLQDQLSEFRQELLNLRFQHATAQLENTRRIPQVKKTIARILTVLKEKDMETSNA